MIQIAICDDDAVMLTEMQSVITQHMEPVSYTHLRAHET